MFVEMIFCLGDVTTGAARMHRCLMHGRVRFISPCTASAPGFFGVYAVGVWACGVDVASPWHAVRCCCCCLSLRFFLHASTPAASFRPARLSSQTRYEGCRRLGFSSPKRGSPLINIMGGHSSSRSKTLKTKLLHFFT